MSHLWQLLIDTPWRKIKADYTRTTRTPAFWGYPSPPHDYPHYWFILDPKSNKSLHSVDRLDNTGHVLWNLTGKLNPDNNRIRPKQQISLRLITIRTNKQFNRNSTMSCVWFWWMFMHIQYLYAISDTKDFDKVAFTWYSQSSCNFQSKDHKLIHVLWRSVDNWYLVRILWYSFY